MKKFVAAAIVLVLFAGLAAAVYAEDAAEGPKVSVGGHIKMTVFDRVNAMSMTYTAGPANIWNKTFGITFKELDLYVNAKINDWLSFEASPKFSLSTGATPKLGAKGPSAGKDFSFTSMGHGKAVMMVELPWEVHMEVGQIYPIFTAEYGKQLFWEDEFNVGPFIGSHGPAGSFHDNGIEFSKSFSITEEISLPVYLYYLNGGTETGGIDINNQPGVMLHIEPSYGPLTLLASAYAYKYDAAERLAQYAWSVGMHFKWEGLEVRAEGAMGTIEDGISTDVDEFEQGYMVKALYKVLPWAKVFVTHESDLIIGEERDLKYAVGAVIYLSDATLIQCIVDVQEKKLHDGSQRINWTRPGISIRSTF